MSQIDRYKDMYESGSNYTSGSNYKRLLCLFVVFVISLYLRLGGIIDKYVGNPDNPHGVTAAECLLVGLDINCDVKK